MPFNRIELCLITMIVLFFSLSVLFIILLITSRITKINTIKKRKLFEPLADNAIFSVIFENKTYQELLNDNEYTIIFNDDFFRLLLLESVIKLHKSYTGEFAAKIETFYIESSLIDETYSKLDAFNWSVKCEAIGELAEMNIQEGTSLISKYVDSKNLILRQEALKAIVKLNGIKGLSFLNTYKEPLSDWMQLNLLAIIKKNFPTTVEPYYSSFTSSKNPTIVTFGKRLETYYEQNEETFAAVNKIEPPDSDDDTAFYNTKREIREKSAITFKQRQIPIILIVFKKVTNLSLILFACFFISHLIELTLNKTSLFTLVFYYSLVNDIFTTALITLIALPFTFICISIWKRSYIYVITISFGIICIIHVFLSIYFFKSKIPLGSDLFGYSMHDVVSTSSASGGASYRMLFFVLVIISLVIFLMYLINKAPFFQPQKIKKFIIVLLCVFFASSILKKDRINNIDEYENYIARNKTSFFFEKVNEYNAYKIENTFVDNKQYYISEDTDSTEKFINRDYPFLKTDSKRNTLGTFFTQLKSNDKPNLVFIILEGMGRDFVGNDAKLGSLTPF